MQRQQNGMQRQQNGMEANGMERKTRPMLGAQRIYLQQKSKVELHADVQR